jgi:hypothetical protein
MCWEVEEFMDCDEFDSWVAWLTLKKEWENEAIKKQRLQQKTQQNQKRRTAHRRGSPL